MKFITASEDLLKSVQLIAGVAGTNSTLSILNNLLFELNKKELKITGSDGETTMITTIEVDSKESGSFAVPVKILMDLLKTFPNQPLTFNVENNQLEIIDEKDNYFIALENFEDFPSLPEVEVNDTVIIKASILTEAITKTVFATGTDTMRPVMTGVLFQFSSQGSNFVATDAHRLVKYTRTDVITDSPKEIIMPKKPLNLLKNSLGTSEADVKIEFSSTNARYTHENTTWICRLIEGKYPNYDAVIPKENPNVLTINTQTFLAAIRRVSIFSNKSTNQVKLVFNGNMMELGAEDLDFQNKASMTLPCDYNGEALTMGYNSKFLAEMLSNLSSEDITMEMSMPNRAGILKPVNDLDENEELLMIVMPVMVSV